MKTFFDSLATLANHQPKADTGTIPSLSSLSSPNNSTAFPRRRLASSPSPRSFAEALSQMVVLFNSAVPGPKLVVRKKMWSVTGLTSAIVAFLLGTFVSYFLFHPKFTSMLPSDSLIASKLKDFTHNVDGPQLPFSATTSQQFVHSDTSAPDGFLNAWRHNPESCKQWFSMQTLSRSYLDAYIIGSQKGATSTITKRLFNLRVRPTGMKKEWHYFNKMDENGTLTGDITTHVALSQRDLKQLRYDHYKTGFPDDKNATVDRLPGVDRRSIAERTLIYDGTVEYLHTDKAAFLAHALTPHVKIVATVRNPIDRALSQFNMVVRSYNKAYVAAGERSRPATAEWFHEVVVNEIEKISKCGYDADASTIDRPTSKMLACVFGEGKVKFDNLLYVTRGLYHIHIATWRNYFPDHRILVLSFPEITTGNREAHEALAKFLCIRPFSDEMITGFQEAGSSLSFGQQVASGMENKGVDSYSAANDSYLLEISPKTRTLLNDFYRPANRKLEALLGKKMYDYE